MRISAIVMAAFFSLLAPPGLRAEISPIRAKEIITETISHFSEDIAAIHHLPINIVYYWHIDAVQALGGRMANRVQFEFYGGLIKGDIDEDALRAIVCHELGHVLGGAPTRKPPYPFAMNSLEGQADYFATAKCLRRLFSQDDNERIMQQHPLDEDILVPCRFYDNHLRERATCHRILRGVRKAYRFIANDPRLSYNRRDPSIVHETLTSYPSPQCRLDTALAGALCSISPWDGFDFENEAIGACDETIDQGIGARPPCWYRRPQ